VTRVASISEKPLPHSLEAERALLAGIILGADGPWPDASEFFLPFHQSLSQALTRLKSEGKPTDLVLIADNLSRLELENCGGIAYIASLLDGVPRISNLKHYADSVRQSAKVRRNLQLCDLMAKKLASVDGNAAQVLEEVSELSIPLHESVAEPVNRLRAVSITELLRIDLKPRGMVLHPFIPSQGLAMLYSKRGVGKTFISLGIAIAVASGTRFLKWNAPVPRRVLFVDGEMPATTLKQRISDIVAGTNIGAPLDNLRLITPDLQDRALPDLATLQGQQEIESHLDGVDLLILDNLSSLVRAVKENEGEGWLPVQEWVLSLRRRGISVLFVHHAGKTGSQRGTSRREDLLDSVVTLKNPADYSPSEGLRFDVHYEKARGFCGEDARPFEVRLHQGKGGEALWTVTDPEISAAAKVAEMHWQGMSYRDIADELGLSKSKVHRIVSRMGHVSHDAKA